MKKMWHKVQMSFCGAYSQIICVNNEGGGDGSVGGGRIVTSLSCS